jgi:hypothetical protein
VEFQGGIRGKYRSVDDEPDEICCRLPPFFKEILKTASVTMCMYSVDCNSYQVPRSPFTKKYFEKLSKKIWK